MKLGATFLFVTHDQVEAMSMGDKVGVLNEGRIIQVGTPKEIYNRPRDVFVASFVGSPGINLVEGEVRDGRMERLAASCRSRLPMARPAPHAPGHQALLRSGSGPKTSASARASRWRAASTTWKTMGWRRLLRSGWRILC
jgi:multiple sugar transport system ATP-binding protein